MTKGTRFYLIQGDEKFLRKIRYVGKTHFEWHYGFAELTQLIPNSDNKSKVKYVLINN